jgi:hypothetical protein
MPLVFSAFWSAWRRSVLGIFLWYLLSHRESLMEEYEAVVTHSSLARDKERIMLVLLPYGMLAPHPESAHPVEMISSVGCAGRSFLAAR